MYMYKLSCGVKAYNVYLYIHMLYPDCIFNYKYCIHVHVLYIIHEHQPEDNYYMYM